MKRVVVAGNAGERLDAGTAAGNVSIATAGWGDAGTRRLASRDDQNLAALFAA
jgi:hypothetical protein